uniref:Uncharacterized protein n=1 Tax=Schlesneria paludicola TaxID=360056 RepID=A0A7C2K3K3_9PLAN
MSRGSPLDWLVLDRLTQVELSSLYEGWLCRSGSISVPALVRSPGAWPTPQAQAPPEFIWASHPS